MTLPKSIATYGKFPLHLELNDEDYQVFKSLLKITKEYADHEADVWNEGQEEELSKAHRNAGYSLEDVNTAFDHYDFQPDRTVLVPGNAAVMLTRGKYMDTQVNQVFMKSAPAQALIARLRELLNIPERTVVDGY